MLLKYFYFLDLFRRPVYLRFKSQEKTSSKLGLLCSLLIYALLLYEFSKNDIFYNLSPKITNQPKTQALRPPIKFSDKIFTVSLVDDDSAAYIDPSIFTIKAKNVFMNSSDSGYKIIKTVSYGLHVCNMTDFIADPTVYEKLGLKNTLCLDNNSFVLEGYWDESIVTYFSLEVELCNNFTSNNTCQSKEKMNEFLSMKYFNLVYSDLIIDTSNYTTPITTKYRNDFQLVDLSLKRMMNIFIQSINLVTKEGIIYDEKKEMTGLAYESSFSDFKMNHDQIDDDIIFICDFYSAKESYRITRSYNTFLEVLSDLGGLFSFLMVFGFLITYLEKKFYLTKKIMNNLYSFQQEMNSPKNLLQLNFDSPKNSSDNHEEKGNSLEIDQARVLMTENNLQQDEVIESKKENVLNNEKFSDFISPIKSSTEINRKNREKISKINQFRKFQNMNSKISMSFLEFLYMKVKNFSKCCKKSFKQRLYLKAEEIYDNEIDITYILKKIQEIEKLKLIILNSKQLSLFNLLAKPMIYINKNTTLDQGGFTISEIISSTVNEKSLKSAIAYYESQRNNKNLNLIDNNLFKMIDENLNQFKPFFENKE